MRTSNQMPVWPAYVMFLLAAGCMYPAVSSESAPSDERYRALGQEPGWKLTIDSGKIDYVGNYGETRITVTRPDPRPTFNGRRYETDPLTVDITYGRCNDAMSGFGFEHQVTVIANGETYRGCGGERRSDWDN